MQDNDGVESMVPGMESLLKRHACRGGLARPRMGMAHGFLRLTGGAAIAESSANVGALPLSAISVRS